MNIRILAAAFALALLANAGPAHAWGQSVATKEAHLKREQQEKARDRAWFEAERVRRANARCYFIDSYGDAHPVECASGPDPIRLPPSLR